VSPSAADVQSGNSTIVKGMSGNSVTEIQNLLNAGGSKLNPDGKFGTNTYNALIAFQKKSGTTNQKGIVDADTYNKLKGGGEVLQDVQNDNDFNADDEPLNNSQPKNNVTTTDSSSEFVV
jgi:peptidoglycan hydrolase-like protein with peptidoglycan-binding domain